MSGDAILLLALLATGHFVGDFSPLARPSMLAAKAGAGTGARGVLPPVPLVAHAAVHGGLVLAAVAVTGAPAAVALAAAGIELSTHLLVDYVRMRLGLRYPGLGDRNANPFWYGLGVDQLAHVLVLIGIAGYVL